jgi:hypothetical protein
MEMAALFLIGCGGMAWIVKGMPQRRMVAMIFFVGSPVLIAPETGGKALEG